MQYHLDRTIHFTTEQEFKSLYRWSLQEFSAAGQPLGTKQIPWMWSLYFTGTDMTLHHVIEVERETAQPQNNEQIQISLTPGQRRYTATRYSMFGTDRTIKSFTLTVRSMQTQAPPSCTAWGFPSYSTDAEVDFPAETVGDAIGFELTISEREFATLRLAAQQSTGDYSITFAVSGVQGFYADWSPGISTSAVKVLAAGTEQRLVIPEDLGPLPRLGKVNEAKLYLARRSALAPSNRNTETVEADEQVEEPEIEQAQPSAGDQNRIAAQMLASTGTLQKAVTRLRLPIWLILVVAIAILLFHAK